MNPTPLAEIALTLFAVSWRTSLLIIPLILFRFLIRRKMPAQLVFVAWVIVAVRLLLPFSMPTDWSPYNWLISASNTNSEKPTAIYPNIQEVTVDRGTPASPGTVSHLAVPMAVPLQRRPGVFLTYFWFGGIALLIGVRVGASWRFRRQLRGAVPLNGTRVERLLSDELTFPVFRRPRCYLTDGVSAPALFGLLQPRLLFPPGLMEKLTDDELRLVIRHELGHWQRHDLLTLGVIHFSVIVHWFNPLVWLAAWFARIDCELGCDEFVLGRKKETDARAYAATLLKVLAVTPGQLSTLGSVALLESKRRLLERVSAIADFRGFGVARVTASLIVLLALGIASITREATAADQTRTATASPATIPATAAANAPAPMVEQEARNEAAQAIKLATTQMEVLKGELAAAEGRAKQIKDFQATGRDLATLPFIATQPVIVQLRQSQTDQRLQLANLSLRYAERHPHMIRARNELEATDRELARVIDDLCRQVEAQHGTSVFLYQTAERDLERRQQNLRDLIERQGGNFDSSPTKSNSGIGKYTLRPLDRLRVEVFQEPDLGKERQISADGKVMLPLIGTIELSGKTISQAEDYVSNLYRQGFVLNPRVTITIVQDLPKGQSQEFIATSDTLVITLDEADGIANQEDVRRHLAAIRKVSDAVRIRVSRPDSNGRPFDLDGPAIRWIYSTVRELDLELVELTNLSLANKARSRDQN